MNKNIFKLDKKADREIIGLAWLSITEQILEMMVGIFFDFTVRSAMYLLRMKKGKWKYLRG